MKFRVLLAVLAVLAALALASSPIFADPSTVSERTFQLPHDISDGEGKQVDILIDEGHLKLATIVLRDGTALPTHSTPVPATIQVLEGEGLIHVEGEAVPVSAGTIVVLAAGQEHDVVPAPKSHMSLLVHYLREATDGARASHAEHEH